MPEKKVASSPTPRFNYLVLLDIIVLACILAVASRPDGLAITVSAVILAAGAVLYRCSVGVKSYMSNKASHAPASKPVDERAVRRPVPETPVESDVERGAKSNSWLRESK